MGQNKTIPVIILIERNINPENPGDRVGNSGILAPLVEEWLLHPVLRNLG